MKKKLGLVVVLLLAVFTVTACDKKETKKEEKKETKKQIVLKDDNKGYKTTFTYDKKDNYSDVEEETGGASTEITFKNEDKDVEFDMYYNTTSVNSYETAKENRSEQKYYKEVKVGKYEGYVYGEYSSGLYLIVKLDVDKNDMAALLFVSIDRIDTKEDVVISEVFNKDLKPFFDTIKFERTK